MPRAAVSVAILLLLAGIAVASPADDLRDADAFRKELSASASMRRQRINWEKGIERYTAIAKRNPKDAVAPKALYEAANLAAELQRYSGFRDDLIAARNLYRQVAERYPKSPMADDALYRLGLAERALGNPAEACAVLRKVVATSPRGGYADLAKREIREIEADPAFAPSPSPPPAAPTPAAHAPVPAEPPPPSRTPVEGRASVLAPVTLEGIRFWANPEYTRVVIDLSGPSRPTHFAVAGAEADGLPPRIVIDIPGATLKDPKQPPVEVGNGLLRRIRAARHTADEIRVVVDLESVGSYQTFTLPSPDRIVIDVFGAKRAAAPIPAATALTAGAIPQPPTPPSLPAAPTPVPPTAVASPAPPAPTVLRPSPTPGRAEEAPPTLAQQLGLTVRRVILDPGHGGKDSGAIGPSGLHEKDVVLDIGLRLRDLLRQRYGLEVIMTRETDVFLELPERTAIANTKEADLFISIHANAARRRAASGIETYYLNLASSRESAETAARENMTSVAGIGDLNRILAELLVTTKVTESSKLARTIHGTVVGGIRRRYRDVQDLGVKQAPFYVLIGALMPSILSEVSFISNKAEESRLASPDYRGALAESLAAGIAGYVRSMGKG